ncbi:SDR family NAD(P)-dependent oxidoreductase [Rathayibacter sp. YIM 133350]|uniref:SDR family NAD(P)-dependent oxidoreductase n=1 Tax=Rathayibacter sp. YIM 133350 TaxID=3131992 RepID=UPI00307D5947
MSKRVVLITGTSSGIGLELAVGAAAAGWTVVATMRNAQARGEALRTRAAQAGVELSIRELDVTDEGAIKRCVDDVIAEFGALDAVVNNAGAGHVGTIENESVSEVRAVMETNFFSVVALTRAVMPHLRRSSGVLVAVSSVGGVVGQPFNEAYCASKFAVEGFFESLAPVAAAVGVRVAVIEPGAVNTAFVASATDDIGATLTAAGPYEPALRAYVERTMNSFASSNAQSPGQVAAVILGVLADGSAPFRTQTSEWAASFAGMKLSDLDGSHVTTATGAWIA